MPRGGYRPGAGRPKKSASPEKPAAKRPATKKTSSKKQPGSAKAKKPESSRRALPPPVIEEALIGEVLPANLDPLDYMLKVMNDEGAEAERRDRMAIAAAPYKHGKVGEAGKKQQKADAARGAGGGRYGSRPAPGSASRVN